MWGANIALGVDPVSQRKKLEQRVRRSGAVDLNWLEPYLDPALFGHQDLVVSFDPHRPNPMHACF
jgi:hypothetical protein